MTQSQKSDADKFETEKSFIVEMKEELKKEMSDQNQPSANKMEIDQQPGDLEKNGLPKTVRAKAAWYAAKD